MLIVHHLDDSRSQRILWLLEELGLPYEIRQHRRDPESRLAPPELKLIHALGKSPVVEDNGKVIAESGAIVDYVLRHYGNGRLAPAQSSDDYDVFVHWLHYIEGSAMCPFAFQSTVKRLGVDAQAAVEQIESEIFLNLAFINDALEGRDYLMGEF